MKNTHSLKVTEVKDPARKKHFFRPHTYRNSTFQSYFSGIPSLPVLSKYRAQLKRHLSRLSR